MSKATKTSDLEETDENVIFDDGFSVVDDISAGGGPVEEANQTKDDKTEEVISAEEDVDMKETEVKQEKEIKLGVTSEEKKETTKPSSDAATLILSNDDDLGTETSAPDISKVKTEKLSEKPKEENTKSKQTESTVAKKASVNSSAKKTPLKKKGPSSYVWVTNISKSVNASSLKKHFLECGRVNTAKVVTNGNLFFGYVEFDSSRIAQECVTKKNNSVLDGKKILVSRNRPDVTKKNSSVQKKPESSARRSEAHKKVEDESKKGEKKENDKTTKDDKKQTEPEKKNDKVKVEENDKKRKIDSKLSDKQSKSTKDDLPSRIDELRHQMSQARKKLDFFKTALDRSQTEARNLRRRFGIEQKKCKGEELRANRYKQQIRKLTDELRDVKEDFKKDMHRLTRKHKTELEKAEYDRVAFLKREDDLRRRQEDLNREFKKLEEAKKALEHHKRSRNSRSLSPPSKRFRGRNAVYPDVSPPPPPKLSGDLRKPLLDRPPAGYYEEKKSSRGVYERLGDYADKPIPRESSNGRYRSSYPVENSGSQKNWSQHSAEPWKKNSAPGGSNFMQPYLERFGGDSGYHPPSASYYPPGTTEYPKRYESSRKY